MESKLKVIIGCIGVMSTGYLINHKHNYNLDEISKLKDENTKLNDKLKIKLDEENKYNQKIKYYKNFLINKDMHVEFSNSSPEVKQMLIDETIKKFTNNITYANLNK